MYEEIIITLQKAHFYPDLEKTGNKITGVTISCPGIIMMEEKAARVREVLADVQCTVSPYKNHGYILVELNKKKVT